MWLDNIKDWTQWKGREDEEGLERCGWTTSQSLDTVEGKRRRGRPRKMWLDNIKDWTQ